MPVPRFGVVPESATKVVTYRQLLPGRRRGPRERRPAVITRWTVWDYLRGQAYCRPLSDASHAIQLAADLNKAVAV